MARYSKVIELLEQDKPVFCSGLVWNGNLDDLTYVTDKDYDMVIIEMEHQGLDFTDLRTSLQYLLSRKKIAEGGSLLADPAPFVRIPPNARERNQWVLKQILDTGVYGLVLPHLNTVEEAQAAVVASRYPQVPGAADFEPEGERGWWYRIAPRYWGLTPAEYFDAADLWPLDPDGNMLLMGIVEEPLGVKNIRDILREVKGIGAIWAGPGRHVGVHGSQGQRQSSGCASQLADDPGGLQGVRCALRHRRYGQRSADAVGTGFPDHHHLAGKDDGGAGGRPKNSRALTPGSLTSLY